MEQEALPPDLRARLERVIRLDYIDTWLANPIPLLEGRTPLQVIRAGELDRVASIIADLEQPGFS